MSPRTIAPRDSVYAPAIMNSVPYSMYSQSKAHTCAGSANAGTNLRVMMS